MYEAYASELGIIVKCDDPERLRQKLYAIRRDNPDFQCLSFIISPANGRDLWIAKNAEG